ncbi:MAG: rod shape-determining protein MreC [Candidatus Berkelbacteria bacterium]
MKNNYKQFIFVILTAFFILLWVWPTFRKDVSYAAQSTIKTPASAFSFVGKKIKTSLYFWTNIQNLTRQNAELVDKITQLQIDRSRITELENENTFLKKEIGFTETYGSVEMVPARIIERDPISFLDYIVIDKGGDDGVKGGQPVMSGGALIGKVSQIFKSSAKITLITSKDSIIQAMLQDSRTKGTLSGGVSGLLLENIIQDVDFKKGEYVVTSGLGGSMSPGLLIGRAASVQTSGGIYKSIVVEPLADLSKIELVFVQK